MKRCIYHGVEIGRDGRCPRCARESGDIDTDPGALQTARRLSEAAGTLRISRGRLAPLQIAGLLAGVAVVTVLAIFGTLELMHLFGG